MKIATGEIEEELPASREGKVNGGKARANGMTPEERSGLARKAAQARWNKTRVAYVGALWAHNIRLWQWQINLFA